MDDAHRVIIIAHLEHIVLWWAKNTVFTWHIQTDNPEQSVDLDWMSLNAASDQGIQFAIHQAGFRHSSRKQNGVVQISV